ncbi:alpha-amylase family glycosyl hydrolase [Agarivorans albus]|uniref:Trehalose synthase n=1 Tax=Agarivorans albus MKT 106 TaxID=1331007 RepID=R9PR98_AGAAL|nr:alpha-amylase family glycosyl hydrolase [Agarivorans albus]GAD03917.1 trehalose synthase [Agarivorans albus MKT 106]
MTIKCFRLFFLVLMLGSAAKIKAFELDIGVVASEGSASSLPAKWYSTATFMEIYVRAYKDSNGDGIGDFNGLTSKLDYLQDLGIKGIWLLPIMKSQDRDHGYAAVDYRKVEPDYGTEEDFKRLLAEAHKRGIGVIIDYTLNHSGAESPLFIESAKGNPTYRDWYHWSDYKLRWTNWTRDPTWHESNGAFYYGLFWDQMPDFNLDNPEVVAYHQNSMRYWLNMGVDGFRFDAVNTLFEHPETGAFDKRKNFAFMSEAILPVVREYENRFAICEVPFHSKDASAICDSAFYFGMHARMMGSAKFKHKRPKLVKDILDANMDEMATILSNHDSFTGGRLNEQFAGNIGKYKAAVTTLLTLPGTPFVYYGDEVAMGHRIDKSDPDADHRLRAPMSWTADPINAGFSSGIPFRELARNSQVDNLDRLSKDPNSIYHHYRDLIHLRNKLPAMHSGSFSPLSIDNGKVFLFERQYKKQRLVIAINYADSSQLVKHVVFGQCLKNLKGAHVNQLMSGIRIPPHGYSILLECS